MPATTDQGDKSRSTEIRKRGVELDKMYQERFPDTDDVFEIADSEGYIISEQHHPEFFRHYTEIAKLWTAQGYLPRCGPLTMPKLEARIQQDKPQPKRQNPTQGEIAFWSFCHRAPGYECQVVDEESGQTPDYTISVDNQKIIVEVKDIGREHTGGTVGAIARRKIRDANKQLNLSYSPAPSVGASEEGGGVGRGVQAADGEVGGRLWAGRRPANVTNV